jgi:hypothetical protein
MKMFSVTRKLSTARERRQKQSCLFRKGDYRNKAMTRENYWVRFPMRMVSLARKLRKIERCQHQNSSGKITGTKVINSKTVLSSSLGKDVAFRDNNNNNNNNVVIFNDTYRAIRFMVSFRTTKIVKKRKHL